MSRVTITEVARQAGVSISAVSYALNGRPGVSPSTRARILQVAEQLGWQPDASARRLTGAKTETFGLVLSRPAKTLSAEAFYMDFLAGLQMQLAEQRQALLLQVTPRIESEIEIHRHWWSTRQVDGVFVLNLREHDPRVKALSALGAASVVVGHASTAGDLTSVWVDYNTAMADVVRYLAQLGHRRLARVAGFTPTGAVRVRDNAFARALEESSLTAPTVHTDFTGRDGARATRELLAENPRPTGIIYDNDVMAVAGLSVATELGIDVPGDLSLLSWEDSAFCEVTYPSITAISQDNLGLGAFAAQKMLEQLQGAQPGPHLYTTPTVRLRGSSGLAPSD